MNSRETLRVLLVSTQLEVRDEVGGALMQRGSDHRLHWVSQPELAPTRAQDLLPHVILVDDSIGEAGVISLLQQMAKRYPDVAPIAMIEKDGLDLASRAVLAGARGFVLKPLQASDLINVLRQVLSQARPTMAEANPDPEGTASGRVIVFCAPKGGTGRTTLAINAAVALRQIARQPVVLVDADYVSPALDVALNLPHERNISDLLARLPRLDEDLIFGVLAEHASDIRVLLAPPPADFSSPISLPHVQEVLAQLIRLFPWVVIDLGLPLDETAFAFLDGANRIVMSVLPEMVGLRNTRLMLDQLHARGYPDDKVWLVLNRATLIGGITVHDIEERLHVQIAHAVPDDQPLATHSVNRGVPLVMTHGRTSVARAITQLAQHLAADVSEEKTQQAAAETANGGLMNRFLRRTRLASA